MPLTYEDAALLDDAAWLAAFERCELPGLHHRDHLRIAFLYLRAHPAGRAAHLISTGLLAFARYKGAEHIYDQALTDRWIARMTTALAVTSDGDFPAFVAAHPELFEK